MSAGKSADAIRLAARLLFLRSGLRRVSMDDIARQAGVTKQTVYRYYPSKEKLFVAVMRELAAEGILADIQELIPCEPVSESEFAKILHGIAQRILDRILNPSYIDGIRVFVSEARNFPELAEAFRTSAIAEVGSALKGIFTSEHVVPILTVTEITPALRMFVAPIMSAEYEALITDPRAVHDRMSRLLPALIDLFVSAVTDQRRHR